MKGKKECGKDDASIDVVEDDANEGHDDVELVHGKNIGRVTKTTWPLWMPGEEMTKASVVVDLEGLCDKGFLRVVLNDKDVMDILFKI